MSAERAEEFQSAMFLDGYLIILHFFVITALAGNP
ncbi:MAG: hypothetical protein AOA66_0582 [Candidatus Bathyarchaeota archaeon BA2]|nr:MAG: hypothetical protein AOA66_0582 [Candidatus Bathyarchaeota archaeon BA2]